MFTIVPVPALLFVALLILMFGTDHPRGKWADRHRPLADVEAIETHNSTTTDKKEGKNATDTGKGASPRVLDLSTDVRGMSFFCNHSFRLDSLVLNVCLCLMVVKSYHVQSPPKLTSL